MRFILPVDDDTIVAPKTLDTDGDYYTSAAWSEAARRTMGGIDLDPASCELANWGDGKNPGVRADKYFSFKDNGLIQEWYGKIWLNPPFGQWNLWGPKFLEELDSGRIEQACLLIPLRALSSKSLHEVKLRCRLMMVPNGREKLWGPKAERGPPDQGHVVLYYGPNLFLFYDEFSKFGEIFKEVKY
jgi:hypothetical protein